jgi:hypothetical protein
MHVEHFCMIIGRKSVSMYVCLLIVVHEDGIDSVTKTTFLVDETGSEQTESAQACPIRKFDYDATLLRHLECMRTNTRLRRREWSTDNV